MMVQSNKMSRSEISADKRWQQQEKKAGFQAIPGKLYNAANVTKDYFK